MKYYIFDLKWSQTDTCIYIIYAATKKIAQARADIMGARYADYIGESDKIVNA